MLIITAVYLGDKVLRVVDGAGFEPATSAMPTPRSFQADLPAHYEEVSAIILKDFVDFTRRRGNLNFPS